MPMICLPSGNTRSEYRRRKKKQATMNKQKKTDSTGGTERSDDPVLFSQGDIVYEFFEFFLSDSFYPEQIFRRLE